MNAWQTHQHYFNSYIKYYERDNGAARLSALHSSRKNDFDVLKEAHRFLRDENLSSNSTYEEIVAAKYYAQLFKQYACIDLKHYKTSKVGLRWRTEDEVVKGIGQFSCGSVRCEFHEIKETESGTLDVNVSSGLDLKVWEMNFSYLEPEGSGSSNDLVRKNALVKVILCPKCSKKLRYSREHESSNKAASSSSSSRKDRSTTSERFSSQRKPDSRTKKRDRSEERSQGAEKARSRRKERE